MAIESWIDETDRRFTRSLELLVQLFREGQLGFNGIHSEGEVSHTKVKTPANNGEDKLAP